MFNVGLSVFFNRTEIVVNLRSPRFWNWGISKIEFDECDCTWEACAGPIRVALNHRKNM